MTRVSKLCRSYASAHSLPKLFPSPVSHQTSSFILTLSRPSQRSRSSDDLPTEIIAEIFMLCHLTELDLCNTESRDVRVIISHVCQRWRAISLSVPLLWSTISVRLPTSHSFQRLQTYLTRSALCPLTLLLYGTDEPTSEDLLWMERHISVILPHCSRLKSFELMLFKESKPSVAALLQGVGLPILDHLMLHLLEWPKEDVDMLLGIFHHCPLSSFTWHGDIWVPSNFSLTHLTRLDLGHLPSMAEVYDLLAQCVNAIRISIKGFNEPASLYGKPLITLPNLEIFSIDCSDPLNELYDHLRLPNLKVLSIQQHLGYYDMRHWEALERCLDRSQCDLHKLNFRDTLLHRQELDSRLSIPNSSPFRISEYMNPASPSPWSPFSPTSPWLTFSPPS